MAVFAGAPRGFLIDRQGYLRAISVGSRALARLPGSLAAVRQLNDEPTGVPEASERVH